MCGRTYCSLSAEGVTKAAAYRRSPDEPYKPCQWLDTISGQPIAGGRPYEPHYNQTRGHYLPIVVNKTAVDKQSAADAGERVLVSMQWGLWPHWMRSGETRQGLNPTNCRFETMTERNMFSPAIKSGRRCVVLVDGFFEWKTNKDNSKDPYFLYFNQKYVDFKSPSVDSVKNEFKLDEHNGWLGPRLLSMAGLYNFNADIGFTFTIITVDSHPSIKWLHSRMPAILDTEDSVRRWLDIETVLVDDAIKLLVPFGGLQYHPVSREMSSATNNSINNILPQKPKTKQKTIDQWFTKASNANKSHNDLNKPIKDDADKDCHPSDAKKVKL